jgi:hypothetical protein
VGAILDVPQSEADSLVAIGLGQHQGSGSQEEGAKAAASELATLRQQLEELIDKLFLIWRKPSSTPSLTSNRRSS